MSDLMFVFMIYLETGFLNLSRNFKANFGTSDSELPVS